MPVDSGVLWVMLVYAEKYRNFVGSGGYNE